MKITLPTTLLMSFHPLLAKKIVFGVQEEEDDDQHRLSDKRHTIILLVAHRGVARVTLSTQYSYPRRLSR
jgi:hypothetical protein